MSTAPELDIRFYSATGLRMTLPADWIVSIDFQIGEQGGYLDGTLKVSSPYGGGFQTFEVERVDVRLWGQMVYRGFIRISQTDTNGENQTASPSLYGMIEKLNGYLVRRPYAYAAPADPGVVFTDMVQEYVKRAGRQPNIIIDVGGVAALGLSILQFNAAGKTFSQAMNDLVSLFPGKLIWGCDVDGTGNDRIYLRPRATSVKYKFSVGANVRELLYPRDATQVTNTLIVTGAHLDATTAYPPNIAPNGSFETPIIPGELTSNLLQNTDFSVASGANPGTPWQHSGDPTLDGTYARTGSGAACVFDNNPSAGETIWQDVAITYSLPVHATCWLMTIAGEHWQVRMRMEYRTAGGTVSDNIVGPWIDPPADGVWRHYRLDWPAPTAPGATILRFYLEQNGSVSTGGHGMNADNPAMWIAQVMAEGWQQGVGSGGAFSALDWNNHDNSVVAFDGGAMVKLSPAITGGAGSYAQIGTAQAKRISVQTHAAYYLQAWIYVASGSVDVALGGVVWSGGSVTGTLVGSVHTIAAGSGWTQVQYIVNTGSPADGLDIILRFYTSGTCWVDGVACFFNNLPDQNHQEIYYPGSTYTAVRSVNDYAGSLSGPAAASILTFGVREQEVSNSNILTLSDLDAYCTLYLQAHATSLINAGLTIFGPAAPVYLDGQVKIENLAVAPPALAPSNVRYRIDQNGIEMTIDLDNKRPDLALLLREIQEGKR